MLTPDGEKKQREATGQEEPGTKDSHRSKPKHHKTKAATGNMQQEHVTVGRDNCKRTGSWLFD